MSPHVELVAVGFHEGEADSGTGAVRGDFRRGHVPAGGLVDLLIGPGRVGRSEIVRVLLEVAPLQVGRSVALYEQQLQSVGQQRLGVNEPVEDAAA